MKILNYGSLNIDMVYRVPHIVRPGETIASRAFRKYAGGKGANQSVAIARAGGLVCHAGQLGGDGQWLKEKLAGFGVDTRFIRIIEGVSGQAVIQVDQQGENAIFLYPGANRQITRNEIDRVLSHFQAGDILLVQNEINNVAYLIQTAHEMKMQICLNPAPMDKRVEKYPLRKINMLILNEVEGGALSGRTRPGSILDWLAKKLPETEIVLTLGKRGAIARVPGQRPIKMPALAVKTVDTTAAGDTFIGYYLAGRTQGEKPVECLARACAAAAICVTRPGAMDSIPALGAVSAFLMKQKKEGTYDVLSPDDA